MTYLSQWTKAKEEFEALTGLNRAAQKTWAFRKSATIDKSLKACDQAQEVSSARNDKEGLVEFEGAFGMFSAAKAEYLFVLGGAVTEDSDLTWQEKASYERAVVYLETKLLALEEKIRVHVGEAGKKLTQH